MRSVPIHRPAKRESTTSLVTSVRTIAITGGKRLTQVAYTEDEDAASSVKPNKFADKAVKKSSVIHPMISKYFFMKNVGYQVQKYMQTLKYGLQICFRWMDIR